MWKVEDNWASLETGRLVARVNPRAPHDGLLDLCLDGRGIAGARLMQLHSRGKSGVADFFVRSADLVAQYPAGQVQGISCQVYWRSIEIREFSAVGVELVVSVQTDLLDDVASIALGSELPCKEVLHVMEDDTRSFTSAKLPHISDSPNTVQINRPGPILFRLGKGIGTCMEMVHPTDFSSGQIDCPTPDKGCAKSTMSVIGQPLEKGVIRRARSQALFVPAEGDEAAAIECYRRFAASALPLTA